MKERKVKVIGCLDSIRSMFERYSKVDAHYAQECAVEGGTFLLGEECLDFGGGGAVELFLLGGPRVCV